MGLAHPVKQNYDDPRLVTAPIAMNRMQASEFLGISPRYFDEMVGLGVLPEARELGTRLLWDREELTNRFRDLPRKGEASHIADGSNPWVPK